MIPIIEFEEDDRHEKAKEEALELVKKARAEILRQRRAVAQFRRMYRKGLLPPCSISDADRERMRADYFASGGRITRCPPCTARGAYVSPYWSIDKFSLVRGVREITFDFVDDGPDESIDSEKIGRAH